MNDKETELLMDIKVGEELSECCGAGMYGDYRICEDCGEHC